MSRSTMFLLVAAVVVILLAIMVRSRLSTEEPVVTDAAPVSERVLVARRDITLGSFIQSGADLEWKQLPEGANKENVVHEGSVRLEDYNGAVARRALRAGDAVAGSALMKSGEGGFMSAVLEPGLRAMSIAVDAISGNAGFITPGDRVDLIVTHRVRVMAGKDSNGTETVVSETFVEDVRVLAVDQMLENPENKAILAKTVTVEVNQRQAEQIAIAAEMGKITMALRGLSAPKTATNDNIHESLGSADANQKSSFSSRVHVIRGDQSENIQFERSAK